MHNIIITTECVADLPRDILEKCAIEIIYYDVATEEGVFKDTAEIDARNLMEYINDGKRKAQSIVPRAVDYKNFFVKCLDKYDEIVHICISSGISDAYKNAVLARSMMGIDGRRVRIVDSKHLSSGQGILAIEASKLRDDGAKGSEIVEKIEAMIPRISTSFIAYNADYLYYNGKVDKTIKTMCNALRLHPVLYMNEDGRLTIKRIYIGDYSKASKKYIKDLLKGYKKIDDEIGFVTYAGCSHDKITRIESELERYVKFREVHEVQASATVSCNCGPNTFGVLFKQREDKHETHINR